MLKQKLNPDNLQIEQFVGVNLLCEIVPSLAIYNADTRNLTL